VAWRDKERIPYVDSLIPYSDAGDTGDVSVLFDARVGRRMSDTTKYQNTFASARLTTAYVISSDWRVEANASIRGRWYEDYNGERRTDWRPSAAPQLLEPPRQELFALGGRPDPVAAHKILVEGVTRRIQVIALVSSSPAAQPRRRRPGR